MKQSTLKTVLLLVLLTLGWVWSFGQSTSSTAPGNNPGFFRVYVPYTWDKCAESGSVQVNVKWDGNAHTETTYGSYQHAGQTVPLSTPAWGGTITYVKVMLSADDTHLNGSGVTSVEYDHYVCDHTMAPQPCRNSNGCKRLPGGLIECFVGPGGGETTE